MTAGAVQRTELFERRSQPGLRAGRAREPRCDEGDGLPVPRRSGALHETLIPLVMPPSIGDTGAADGVSTIVDMELASKGPLGIIADDPSFDAA